MLDNTITLSDGTLTHDYDLVSRLGMESLRRETGVPSREGSVLQIKNTVDLNAPASKNRHLIQLFWKDDDADGVASYEGSVHVVISRDKNVSDDKLINKLKQLAAFISSQTNVEDVLIGGN